MQPRPIAETIGPPRPSFRCFIMKDTRRSSKKLAPFCHVEWSRDISNFSSMDLIRSLPVRSPSGLPVYVAASPAAPFSACCASLEMTKASYSLRFDCQFYCGREVVRQRRFKVFPFLSARVTKSEIPCMQNLSRKILCEPRRIDFVAEHRVTEMMKMHANLMSPSAV